MCIYDCCYLQIRLVRSRFVVVVVMVVGVVVVVVVAAAMAVVGFLYKYIYRCKMQIYVVSMIIVRSI